jgi:hypothetical protein
MSKNMLGTSVIPATQEAEVEGSWSKASKITRPYLKNEVKLESLGAWLKW